MKKKKQDKYSKITDKQYVSYFGLNNPEKKDLHKAAFEKAWETRNFEIDKFWQRSMFFWGFLALIFGGYFKVVTEKNTSEVIHLDFYLILLGVIFSVAWLLVICGSKRWQENWEKHIDYLEDEITGPLYKTLYYKRKKNYYSVSGINKILAWVVIVIWIFILIEYSVSNYKILKNIFDSPCSTIKVIAFLIIPLFFTIICIFYFMLYKGQTEKGKLNSDLNAQLNEDEDSAFFIKVGRGRIMKGREISTMNELLTLIDEYSDKKLFFRGETKDYGETACLPHIFRKNGSCGINSVIDRENLWFTDKLESLGVGTPYRPPKSNSTIDNIKSALLNNSPWCWSLWNEDKYEALIQHYMIDFDPLKDQMEKTNLELYKASYIPRFLDITSDITVALHFACSRFEFKLNIDDTPNETNTIGDGYIYVFDFSRLAEAKYIKLVSYPSYTYFYKNGDEYHFQSFDRITHQKGSFLAPNQDEKGSIDHCIWKKEIKNQLYEKIKIKSKIKQELFKIFGGEKGLNYYFPKIPLLSPKNKNIAEKYEKLEAITLLE